MEGAETRETHHSCRGWKGWPASTTTKTTSATTIWTIISLPAEDYGAFVKVLSSNVTIRDAAPYVALHGDFGRHLHFYAGLRPDTIELKNDNKMVAADSYNLWSAFLAPKATLAWTPGAGALHWLPSASFSMGQAFFTQDPRIALQGSAAPQVPSPFRAVSFRTTCVGKSGFRHGRAGDGGTHNDDREHWAKSILTTARRTILDRAT